MALAGQLTRSFDVQVNLKVEEDEEDRFMYAAEMAYDIDEVIDSIAIVQDNC